MYLVWPGQAISVFGLVKLALFYVAALCIVSGLLFALLPRQVIRLQIALYAAVKWKLEPMFWEKETRNTRIMGALIFLSGLATIVLTCKNFR